MYTLYLSWNNILYYKYGTYWSVEKKVFKEFSHKLAKVKQGEFFSKIFPPS